MSGMGLGYYVLDGHIPRRVEHAEDAWRNENRYVKQEYLPNGKFVSTVFLHMDHQWGEGPPLLFETMVFAADGGGEGLRQERCSTWDEAEAQHVRIVAEETGG